MDNFTSKYNNKPIDFDGYYGDQCVDEINQYCVEVLGIKNPMQILPGLNAIDIYNNYKGPLFQKIPYTPGFIPQKGDIVFWSFNHVALFIAGNSNTFASFDQNYPTGSFCHQQQHNFNNVVGVLRFVQGGGTVGDNITRKSSFFDQIWLNRFGKDTNTDLATQQQVTDFNTDLTSNRNRGGNWDQLCIKLGFTGDTNQVTVQQILTKLQPVSRMAELEQIRDIAIKALS